MADDNKRQLIIIGGGPGGYTAAFKAADLGMKVTLIDPEKNPGGVCLYRGCIPSKALLHVAKLRKEAEEASAWGLTYQQPEIDLDKMRDWKNQVIKKLTGGLGQLASARKVEHIQGHASFVDAHTLEVKSKNKKRTISFEHCIIATGSSATVLPGMEPDGDQILSAEHALDLQDIPRRMLVVGGGYIGLEMGSVYAGLGTEVTVAEMTDGLMPGADRDLVKVLKKRLDKLFDDILLNTKVQDVKKSKKNVKVTLSTPDGESTQTFDKILVAAGRKPNTSGFGLETLDVKITEQGFIAVDAELRTSMPHILAIGDVTGQPMLAHKASHEGAVAASILAGKPAAYEPRAIPAVVYTDPEVAWCGLSEAEAKQQGYSVKISKFPWSASGRAATFGRNDGLTKLIFDKSSGRLLGAGIVGKDAGDLIAENVLAIEMAAVATDLAESIHPHPSLSETIMEAAEAFHGKATHFGG